MSKYILLVFIFLQGVNPDTQNLVPNSSFEKMEKAAPIWVPNHLFFEKKMKDWTTPNLGSPDIFTNTTIPIVRPPRKGVEIIAHKARTGEAMVGIKTYGCASYTQHCKEYIQIKLTEQVKRHKNYYIEFWVNPMSTSLQVNNIGLAFSDVEIQDNSEYGIHYFDPVINAEEVLSNKPNEWHKISGTVTAEFNFDYIIIGNFFTDADTKTERLANSIDYSYYFIDDVIVRPSSEQK